MWRDPYAKAVSQGKKKSRLQLVVGVAWRFFYNGYIYIYTYTYISTNGRGRGSSVAWFEGDGEAATSCLFGVHSVQHSLHLQDRVGSIPVPSFVSLGHRDFLLSGRCATGTHKIRLVQQCVWLFLSDYYLIGSFISRIHRLRTRKEIGFYFRSMLYFVSTAPPERSLIEPGQLWIRCSNGPLCRHETKRFWVLLLLPRTFLVPLFSNSLRFSN